MNAPTRRLIVVACALLSASAGAYAAEPPLLVHNPFARPQQDDKRLARTAALKNTQPAEDLLLRATMVSGNTRYANTNGRVMRTGDEIFGYTLQRIFENRAVFIKNGNQTTVYVKPKLEEHYDTRARD